MLEKNSKKVAAINFTLLPHTVFCVAARLWCSAGTNKQRHPVKDWIVVLELTAKTLSTNFAAPNRTWFVAVRDSK